MHFSCLLTPSTSENNRMPDNVTSGFDYIRYIKSKKMFVLSDHEVIDAVLQNQGEMFERSLKTNREHIRHVMSLRFSGQKKASPKTSF